MVAQKLIISLLGCLLFLHIASAQNVSQMQAVKQFVENVTDLETDNLGNLYLVQTNGRIKKLSNKLDSVGIFNDVRQYGRLHSMDVSNPLKMLLYYQDFATIVVLDRFFDTRAVVDLRKAGLVQTTAIAQSYDNNIWAYDDLSARLVKLDESGKILLETPDMRMVVDEPPSPQWIQDFQKQVFVYDSSKGLMVLDYFGAYRTTLPVKGWRNVHRIDRGLAATDSKGLVYVDGQKLQIEQQPLPPDWLEAKKIRVTQQHVFVLQASGRVTAYAFTPSP